MVKYKAYSVSNFRKIKAFATIPEDIKRDIEIVSQVLPFKTNNYVTEQLIDWNNYLEEPLYILNFPQKDMLKERQYLVVKQAMEQKLSREKMQHLIGEIRASLNPHPSEQLTMNV